MVRITACYNNRCKNYYFVFSDIKSDRKKRKMKESVINTVLDVMKNQVADWSADEKIRLNYPDLNINYGMWNSDTAAVTLKEDKYRDFVIAIRFNKKNGELSFHLHNVQNEDDDALSFVLPDSNEYVVDTFWTFNQALELGKQLYFELVHIIKLYNK